MSLKFLNNATFAGKVGIGNPTVLTHALNINVPSGTTKGIYFMDSGNDHYGTKIQYTETSNLFEIIQEENNVQTGSFAIERANGNATFSGDVLVEDNLYLTDGGTVRGKLILNASDRDNVELRAESLGSTMKFFTVGTEALELDASQNAAFAGDVSLADSKKLILGAGSDLQIYHNNSNDRGYIYNATGDLYIENDATDGDIKFYSDDGSGGTAEYFRLDGGSTMNVFSKPTWHGDGVKSFFGNSQDLQIYHDGSNSNIVDTGTGYLSLRGTDLRLQDSSGWNFVICTDLGQGGEVALFHKNIEVFTTTETGVEVTGIVKVVHTDNSYAKYRGQGVFFNRADSYLAPEQDNFASLNVGYNGAKWGSVEINGNFIKFENGPNEIMRIDSSGNVGIGTTAPEAKLTIKGDALTTAQPVRITNSVNDTHTGLFLNNTGNTVGEKYGIQFGGYNQYSIGGIFGVLDSVSGSTSGDITFDLGNGTSAGSLIERMRVTHEGNVGIGDTSPTIISANTFSLSVSSARTDLSGGLITKANGTVKHQQYWDSTGYNFSLSANSGNFKFTGGNVGIGTTDPTSKLQVYGNSTYITSKNTSNNKVVEIGADSSGDGLITLRDSNNNNKIKLYAENNADNYINNGGNVGIGTTSPVYKLDVDGGTRAGGVVTYTKEAGSLNTTGYAVAGITALPSGNGSSCGFTFTCFGGTGKYQKLVYSCYNSAGTWNAKKVIDEGTNDLDVVASANGSTITFTFKAKSSTQSFTPKVTVEAVGTSINSTYA